MIDGHGNDIYKYKDKVLVDFSSNVLQSVHTAEIIECVRKNATCVTNYPEPDAESLRASIAEFHSVNENNVLVTNGSAEAFYMLAQCFTGMKSLIYTPAFSEYEDACVAHRHELFFCTNINSNYIIEQGTQLVWIGNPNNPDGTLLSASYIYSLCISAPETFFIVDEAYGDLCIGFESVVPLLSKVPNLIVVKSLTKTFAIPGLRLGYILASEELLCRLVRIPWRVNSLAVHVGNFILDNYCRLMPDIHFITEESSFLQKQLQSVSGLEVFPSPCNYFLIRLHKGRADDLKEYLVQECGFLIRNAANFRGLNTAYFRIAVQDRESNLKLVTSIRNWIDSLPD